MTRSPPVPAGWLDGCERSQNQWEATVASLTDADVGRPTLLPGWTVGHLVTHVSRNAEGHIRMVEAAARGAAVPMYAGGADERSADIEAGSKRTIAELRAELEGVKRQLVSAWAAVTDEVWATGTGFRLAGRATIADFVFLPWREVANHHIDLGRRIPWSNGARSIGSTSKRSGGGRQPASPPGSRRCTR